MLKLTLSPTAKDLDRILEASYKALYHVIEAASSSGRLYVRVYPHLDSIVAGAIIASRALKTGIRVSITTSLDPPPIVQEPTVLIGYQKLDFKSGNVNSPLLAISSGSIKSIPVHGTTFIDGQGSNTVLASLTVMGGVSSLTTDIYSMALIGIHAGSYIDSMGRLSGLDRLFVDRVSSANPSLDVVTTIKVYKPHVYDLCEALAKTANPLYLGIAGNPSRCQDIFGVEKSRSFTGKPLSTIADSKEVEQIAKQLLDYLSINFKSKITAKDIVAGILVQKGKETVLDFREALDAIIYVSEAERSLARPLITLLDMQIELPLAESRLESHVKSIADMVLSGSITKVGSNHRLKVYLIGSKTSIPLTLVWRAMKIHGVIDPDSVLAVEENGELVASPIQVEEALGHGALRELVGSGLVEFDGDNVWIERKVLNAR